MPRWGKWVKSRFPDPPNPRLMTRRFGKSLAKVFQSFIVEDPMKSCAPLGGGLVRSVCSKAEISFSHLPKSCGACADRPAGELTNRKIEEKYTNPGYLIMLNTTLQRAKDATRGPGIGQPVDFDG